jgi:hypothetical protein
LPRVPAAPTDSSPIVLDHLYRMQTSRNCRK